MILGGVNEMPLEINAQRRSLAGITRLLTSAGYPEPAQEAC
jgi:hypothetical protein